MSANTETGLTPISRNGTLGRFSHYRLVQSLQLLPEKRQTHIDRLRVSLCVYVYMKVFANIGTQVHVLLCHCVCICVCLLISMGVLEVVWMHTGPLTKETN